MSRKKKLRTRAAVIWLVLPLFGGGCAESEFLASSVKSLRSPSGPDSGLYKIGNPYQIDGVTYTPRVDYDYVETGIASWYGDQFHGNRTANGDTQPSRVIGTANSRIVPTSEP